MPANKDNDKRRIQRGAHSDTRMKRIEQEWDNNLQSSINNGQNNTADNTMAPLENDKTMDYQDSTKLNQN